MTAFHADLGKALVLGFFTLALSIPGTANAQDGGALKEVWRDFGMGEPLRSTSADTFDSWRPSGSTGEASLVSSSSSIPSPADRMMGGSGIGVLGSHEGDLGATLWYGSDKATIRALLQNDLPPIASSVLFDLSHRLLLSAAPAPAGLSERQYLTLRLRQLETIGDLAGLKRMLPLARSLGYAELEHYAKVAVTLMRSDDIRTCELVDENSFDAAEEPHWLKMRLICNIRQERLGRAELDLAVLKEIEGDEMSTFCILVAAVLGFRSIDPADPDSLGPTNPGLLEAQLLHRLDPAIAADLVDRLSPAGQISLAFDEKVHPLVRAKATERVVSAGRLPAAMLAELYEQVTFDAEQLSDGLTAIESLGETDRIAARALAYQLLGRSDDNDFRSKIARQALVLAKNDRVFRGVGGVIAERLGYSPFREDQIWMSDILGRTNYALGRYEEATAWLMMARSEAAVSAVAATASWRMLPFSKLAGLSMPFDRASLIAWRNARPNPENVEEHEAVLLALLSALDEELPLGGYVVSEDSLPPETLKKVADLRRASERGLIGESLLRLFDMTRATRLRDLQPGVSAAMVRSLNRLGFPLEARALAIELAQKKGM